MTPTICLLLAALALQPAELSQPFDAPGQGWTHVQTIQDGRKGSAARFGERGSQIDAGPCPVDISKPFTLSIALRTTDGRFSTPLIARDGDSVGLSLVMGREPGRVSFEAWSWRSVKLISRTRVDDGKWHTVRVEHEPTSHFAALWIDGRAEAWADLGPDAPAPIPTKLRFGNNIGADQPFTGDLDEFSLTTTAEHAAALACLAPFTTLDEKETQLRELRHRLLPGKVSMPESARDWEIRTWGIADNVRFSMGLEPKPPNLPLEPKIHGRLDEQGVAVERISFTTWPGYRATGWLWTRAVATGELQIQGRRPAMLMPHGHWALGAIDPVEQFRAARFARAGYIVLIPDAVHVEDPATGVNSGGVMLWNNACALSYLISRDDVDHTRIGVTGASGGGQQTMYLMATDCRIAAAAPVCMVCPVNEILAETWSHCACNHVPGIAHECDAPEIAAAFAPKPALFISATGDWTASFPTASFPDIRALYKLAGNEGAVKARHFDAEHGYHADMRAAAYEFFDDVLRAPLPKASEDGFKPIAADRLLALGPPAAAPDRAALAKEFLQRRGRTIPGHISPAFGIERPERTPLVPVRKSAAPADWHAWTFEGDGKLRLGLLTRGVEPGTTEPITLVVSPRPRAELLLDPPAWLASCEHVAILEPRFTGDWQPFEGAWRRNGMMLGCGEGYAQARDIAQAVENLPGRARVTVVALGEMCVPAGMANWSTRRIGRLIIEDFGPTYEEAPDRLPQCPDIRRMGEWGLDFEFLHAREVASGEDIVVNGKRRQKKLTPEQIGAALQH